MKGKLNISFSGGRSSAYMTRRLTYDYRNEYDFNVTFANTGQEHEATLEFIRDCDERWGFNTVWIEAVVNPQKGQGIRHKIVNFETASRNGEPFEAVVAKEGIANNVHPICSDRLKMLPMRSYLKSIGAENYPTAIGIRADETRRVNEKAAEQKIVYPMVDWFPVTKGQVIDWWQSQEFDLGREQFPPHGLPERLGNCVWCWKKSFPKLIANAKQSTAMFDFPDRMEREYGDVYKYHSGKSVWFRGNRSTQDVLKMARNAGDQMGLFSTLTEQDILDDITNPCGESCEVFPMEIAGGES